MKKSRASRLRARACVVAIPIFLLAAARAEAGDPSAYPEREYAFGAYLWGSGLVGTLEAGPVTANVDASFSDILDHLNVAVMAAGSARVGRFVGTFDGIWLQLEADEDTGTLRVNRFVELGPAEIDAEVDQGIADLKLGYRILEPTPSLPVSVDLLAGGRYWHVRNEIKADFALLQDRSFEETSNWVDPVVGGRVIVGLTPTVQLIAIGDVGGFGWWNSADNSWQLAGLIGYDLSETWSLRLGYRALYLHRNAAKLQMRGPLLGAFYRF